MKKSKIEQVAEALEESRRAYDSIEQQARAAIEAMREPTQQMIDAGFYPAVQQRGAKSVWFAMVDAALSTDDV